MRILLASPVPLDAVAGPATVGRELERVWTASGDEVRTITFSAFERSLPLGMRQVAFFLRSLPQVAWAQAVFLLDPASTGPMLALAAQLARRRCVLRVGGDFLWESYVERTQEPILLSEFYSAPRALTFYERTIKAAIATTLRYASRIVFTTAWQRALWQEPYALPAAHTTVIAPALPSSEASPMPAAPVFLAAHRSMRIKNGKVMDAVWDIVRKDHPEAVLDTNERSAQAYREALRTCYAVIVPSLSEVSPNTVFEALRYGKPFITTRDTGVYEELKDLGIFVDTRDPEAIATAVLTLLDPVQYEQMRQRLAAFAHVRAWSFVAQEFRKELEAVSYAV
jgi:glycosyltransferase involved in cell wall biosynthesis